MSWKDRATKVEGNWKDRAKVITPEEESGVVDTVLSALDYPFAPIREGLGTTAEAITGKKEFSDIPGAVIDPLLYGPSTARSSQKILEDLGVPSESDIPAGVPMGMEKLMTEEELALAHKFSPSAVAGTLADQAITVGAPKAIGKAMQMLPDLIDRESQLVKSFGMTKGQAEDALSASDRSVKNLKNLSEISKQEGLVTPFSSTKGIVEKSSKSLEEAGKKIGQIIKDSSADIDNYLINSGPAEQKAYLSSGFNFDRMRPKILTTISSNLEGSPDHDSALRAAASWLDAQEVKSFGRPDIEQLQKWKKNVSSKISDFSYGNNKSSAKEEAMKVILSSIDEGIEDEIKFAEKFLKGNNLQKFKEAKKVYATSKIINDAAKAKEASELVSKSNFSFNPLDWIEGTRKQSTLANVPSPNIPSPMANPVVQEVRSIDKLQAPLPPTPQQLEQQIRADKNLTPTEKARQINQIRKGM